VSMGALPFAIAALLPVMVGPLSAPGPAPLVARLCGGGTVTIPLAPPASPSESPAEKGDCQPKGCHAGTCRPKDETKRPHRRI